MHFAHMLVRLLPCDAAANALLQCSPALFNVAFKYLIEGYLIGATLDDVAANLPEKSVESLATLVVIRVHPDYPHRVEQSR